MTPAAIDHVLPRLLYVEKTESDEKKEKLTDETNGGNMSKRIFKERIRL